MSEDDLDPARIERARDAFNSVPYARFLGLELGEIEPGEVSIHLNVRDELKQNQGVVHGGAVASLIDTAAAFAVLTRINLNERVTTTDLTIHYLRPINGGRLTATARIVRSGRRLFVLSVEVTNAGVLVATAVTSYLKMA
ncbi:MAG: phenylacetic acid degradation protein [Acidobacteria bacterium]|nr:MAG: phenylacetic acid degradation protein [Acidobacteriota bacterium]